MDPPASNLTSTETIDVRYGYYGMFGTILFFQLLNKLVTYLGPPSFIHGPEEFWRWKNLFISWLHAFITGTWTLVCAIMFPEYRQDLIAFVEPLAYALVSFTTGYFLYDTSDLMRNNKLLKHWEVTFHHFAVTSIFFYDMATARCIGYTIFALFAEVNSFFLHTRKMLQIAQFKYEHWLYRLNNVFNIVSFAVFRGLSLCVITSGMLSPGERLRVSTPYWCLLCACMFVLWAINPILFWRLLKNDFLRKDHKGHKKNKSMSNGNNNVKKIE